MKEDTPKKIIEDLILALLCVAILYLVFSAWIENTIKKECSSCDASYTWCVDYWKDKNMCQED